MVTVLWAAAHQITEEQRSSLLESYEEIAILQEADPVLWGKLTNLKLEDNRRELAFELLNTAQIICNDKFPVIVQPAGDPAFQYQLGIVEEKSALITVRYAFSERVSVDVPQADGSVIKTSVFKHMGWV